MNATAFNITQVFEDTPLKWACISYAITLIIVTTPILLLVVLYERDNPYRILMNQLVIAIIYLGISANLSIEIINIFLYILGPLHPILCYLSFLLQGALSIQMLLLIDAVVIVRYIFTFVIKNPTAAQDDFWVTFISIWSFLLSIVVQTVYIIMPGKNPTHFYVCLGEVSVSLVSAKTKVHYSFLVVALLTICISVILSSRIKYYELKIVKAVNPSTVQPKPSISFDKNRILSVSVLLVIVLIFSFVWIPILWSSSLRITLINQFPYYLLFYYIHIMSVPTFILASLSLVLYKNNNLRRFMMREMANFLNK